MQREQEAVECLCDPVLGRVRTAKQSKGTAKKLIAVRLVEGRLRALIESTRSLQPPGLGIVHDSSLMTGFLL
jgi:hypothetical protein